MSTEEVKEVLGADASQSFDSVGITIAAPEDIREWSKGEVKTQRQSIIVLLSQSQVVCSVSVFLDPFVTMNVLGKVQAYQVQGCDL